MDPSQPQTAPSPNSRIFLETFGCQMNELDSELLRDHLAALGYIFTNSPSSADIILYNTCSVREQAENKVLSRVGRVGVHKAGGADVILGVIGCLAEQMGDGLIQKYPQIDLMCGPGELDKLPMLLQNARGARRLRPAERIALQGDTRRHLPTLSPAADNLEPLDLSRALDPERAAAAGRSAYVRITRGCNKFCSYCVVPRTRGPEVHRPPDVIVDECRRLAEAGIIEITLLGQTVNHYLYTHGPTVSVDGRELPQIGPGAAAFRREAGGGSSSRSAGRRVTTFADLLGRIHDEIPAIRRLRFVTSYPRDFGDDILQVMAASPRICRYLHVPAQSGSNRILKLMNRGYTREQYLDFVQRARSHLPDVCIAGDIIVGFCTETDDDFEQTKDLLRRVRFKNNFIFKYSARAGTAVGDRMPDDVPDHVKRRRNNELLALQAEISLAVHRQYIGRTVGILVQQVSKKSARRPGRVVLAWEGPTRPLCGPTQMSGRTEGDLIAVFELPNDRWPEDFIGRIIKVKIVDAAPLLLRAQLCPTESPIFT